MQDQNLNIGQWNCNRIKPHDLLLLLSELNLVIICPQEAFLKENDEINIKNFESYNYIDNTRLRILGWSILILIWNHILQSKMNLNANLQAIATKTTVQRTKYLLPIHSSPRVYQEKWSQQLNTTPLVFFIILEDSNSHTILYGIIKKKLTKKKGKLLKRIINNPRLILIRL